MCEECNLLKQKINQLIADNLELSSRLENDYDPNKPVRQLTLQEKLEINMGNLVKKYRIPSKSIKNIYCSIVREENEPEFVDFAFDNDRMFKAFYFVDLAREKTEIEKGMNTNVDIAKIPDEMPEIQHQCDVFQIINQLTDISTRVSNPKHNNEP